MNWNTKNWSKKGGQPGTFVAELPKRLGATQRRKLIAPEVDKLLIQARQLSIPLDELVEQLEKRDSQLDRSEARS